MILFKKADACSSFLKEVRKKGKKLGFVPTMGALHKGHLSLVNASRKENDITVCSIFINPTQFNNPEDFKHYPITIEKDIEQLISEGCDVLFLPPVEEIYPAGYHKKTYDIGRLEHILEGYYRPGHFQGVCQVVDRLLQIVQPDNIYMGQKDFQQCMVIKRLLEITGRENIMHLHFEATVRELDGLAMSSRNLRLTEQQRKLSTAIYQELSQIRSQLNDRSIMELKETAAQHLKEKGFMVDYVEIAQAEDLKPAVSTDQPLVALAAASIGDIRLIDNLILN